MRKLKENLIIIGGSGRNVGKTTLANEIIKKFQAHSRIIGLKVSTFRVSEEQYHGDHHLPPETAFLIHQEDLSQNNKDTASMVLSGAETAWYVQTREEAIQQAYDEFENTYNPDNLPVVCESRALTSFIKPGIFIMLVDRENMKDDSQALMHCADRIVYYKNGDLSELTKLVNEIDLTEKGWIINKI